MNFNTCVLAVICFSLATHASAYQSNWKRLDADNGAAYAIDLGSISHTGRQADAVICVVENNACEIMNERRWAIDCEANTFMEETDAGFTDPVYTAPLSIGRRIINIACGKGD